MDEIQIVLAIAVIYFVWRWTSRLSVNSNNASNSISSSSAGSTNSIGSSTSTTSSSIASVSPAIARFNTLASSIPLASINQAQALFPQLSERQLKWEFVRIGRIRNLETLAQALLEDSTSTDTTLASPPVGFLEPIVSLPASSASSTITAKPKYDSLIKRLNLQAQATAQDLELSCSSTAASPSNPANATGEADSRLRKGKGKMSEEKAWKDMSIKEKKEAMVLDARRRMIEKDRRTSTIVDRVDASNIVAV